MILVTGATGTVGSELVSQLVAAGQAVRVFVRDERKVAHLAGQVECAVGDLSQPDTLEAAMRGVDQVFLVTMSFGTEQDVTAIDAAQRMGVKHIVKLSTSEASQPALTIGRWHREREKLIEASGLDWTFLRPGQFMSNTLRWADSIRAQGVVYSPNGADLVAPIDPYDIAAVATVVLTQPGHAGQVYHLTGPALLTVAEQVATLSRVLDKSIQYNDVPISEAGYWMREGGMPQVLVDAMVELMTLIQAGEGDVQTDTVEQLTGRPPRTYEAWCRAHLAAFQ